MASQPLVLSVEPFGGSVRNHNPNLPLIFFDDAAVTRGDGIFETLLIRGQKVCNLDRHLERFVASSVLLDLPEPHREGWLKATELARSTWCERNTEDAKMVWTYTRGREATGIPSAWITVKPAGQRPEKTRVVTGSRSYRSLKTDTPWAVIGAKTLSYAENMAALRWAKANGYGDFIFTDGDRVLEGATSTVVTFRGNKIRSPQTGGDVLSGTTQAALFDYATAHGWRCKEKELVYDDLFRAESVWLISSVRGPVRVSRIDDKKLPACANEAEIRELIWASLSAD